MGKWRVADALATLAFDYPPRADYFRAELETYLLFTREAGVDALSVLGSYAGAIGIPQFMPRSYRLFAVDFDGDGVARLRSSPTDAIGSVANFLKMHGWVPGEPIAYRAEIGSADTASLIAAGLKPSRTLADLAAAGIVFRAEPAAKTGALGALIELVTPDKPSEYRIGLDNFYAITRYNQSSFYAAAVTDLAAALRLAMGR
jgi:membrane-bound lytic murein transglycosylase B